MQMELRINKSLTLNQKTEGGGIYLLVLLKVTTFYKVFHLKWYPRTKKGYGGGAVG